MYDFEAYEASAVRRVAAWLLVLALAHFVLGTRTHAVHGLHVVLAGLFLVPILVSAHAFAVRGALFAALAASGLYVAHLIWSWRNSPMANADQYGMIGVYFIVAVAAGRLVEVANLRKEQRDEIIRRSSAAEQPKEDVPR